MPTGPILAARLSSPADFTELCSTSASLPNPVTEGTEPGDPLIEVVNRRDYVFERNRRLLEVHSVTMDQQGYRFLPSGPGMLIVDMLESLPVFTGIELDLGAAVDVTFALPEPECDDIQAGFATEQVLLRLFFYVESLDDPDREYCEETADGGLRVRGRLLAAQLLARADESVLALHETERLLRHRARLGLDPSAMTAIRPNVLVVATDFPTTEPPSLEAQILHAEAEARLMPCYVRGLFINGRLQGAAVLTYQIDREGALWNPIVTIDAVDQPILTGCIISSMGGITLPRLNPGVAFDVRMTVIFRLE